MNAGAVYRVTVDLYCNSPQPCTITPALWTILGQEVAPRTHTVNPYQWKNVSFDVTLPGNRSKLRFEVYNEDPNQNVDISRPEVRALNA